MANFRVAHIEALSIARAGRHLLQTGAGFSSSSSMTTPQAQTPSSGAPTTPMPELNVRSHRLQKANLSSCILRHVP